MNTKALLHIRDSEYCYALSKNSVRVTLRTAFGDTFDGIFVVYGGKYAYAGRRKRAPLKRAFSDGIYDYYSADLRLKDVRLVYIFEIICGGKTRYFSEDGLSEKYDYSLAYFNSFQLPYINAADIPQRVEWFSSATFYEIFVDRFERGLKGDKPFVNMEWGARPTPKSFAGGDLVGITNRLDYLRSMGVSAVYLTPVFASSSNHKYDIINYYQVDERFGGNAALKELVKAAHARGIRVVLDAVFNHCGGGLKEFKDVLENGRASPYSDWFIIKSYDPLRYECFASCKYMPKFNTSNIEVQRFLTGVAAYWIREYDIDGWRLDVADEVSHEFWRLFRKTVKGIKRDAVIFGESWHDSRPFLRGDEFDGIMNYALTKSCRDFFADGLYGAEEFAFRLSAIYMRNTRQANMMMLNLLDSHDTERFYTLAHKDEDKLICALAVIYMHTGAPCIFYGTELPMEGGYDPDCRRAMNWKAENKYLKGVLRSLSRIRKRKAVAEGEISFYAEGGLFVLERRFKKRGIRLRVNNTARAVLIKPCGKALLFHNFVGGELLPSGFIIEELY